jgi:hypothetical protein
MRLYEIAGRIVKGVNTTPDVGADAVTKQAAKFGNKVDRDGKPPLLHKKAYKNTTPNKLANLNIGESFTVMEWAIIEGGHDLNDWRNTMRIDNFDDENARNSKSVSSKERAAQYLGETFGSKLSRTYVKRLRAKTNKMKTSAKKAERQRGIQLAREFIAKSLGALNK